MGSRESQYKIEVNDKEYAVPEELWRFVLCLSLEKDYYKEIVENEQLAKKTEADDVLVPNKQPVD